jgi:hypothetical protein
VNERSPPLCSVRIAVSSRLLFTFFSRGDDSVAHRLWGRLALNRDYTHKARFYEVIPSCVVGYPDPFPFTGFRHS